jgi:homoserine dehydrogenase
VPIDTAARDRAALAIPRPGRGTIRIGLLGLGQVGTALAALVHGQPSAAGRSFEIAAALVRDPGSRPRPGGLRFATTAAEIFAAAPDVIVEVLGHREPARTLLLEAIARGIPAVTANKSLLAHHGDELIEAAAAAAVPVCYEASVIAGVPFLGPLARRPILASSLVAIAGIVNGTTNHVLSTMARTGSTFDDALADACRRGFAEPDPAKDVAGLDALEKLVVFLRSVPRASVEPGAIEVEGIAHVTPGVLAHAHRLGGVIKPVVSAQWTGGPGASIDAFCGPAFVPLEHPLARIDGVTNAAVVRDRAGRNLIFAGPGAGPDVTAVTLLDDVVEATSGPVSYARASGRASVRAPATAWMVRIEHARALPQNEYIADLFAGHGVRIERTTSRDDGNGGEALSFLTCACPRPRIDAATAALEHASGCEAMVLRALGDGWQLPRVDGVVSDRS